MSVVYFILGLGILLPLIGIIYFIYQGVTTRSWPKQALACIPVGIMLLIAAGVLFSANQAVENPPTEQQAVPTKGANPYARSAQSSTDTASSSAAAFHAEQQATQESAPSAAAIEKARAAAITHIPKVPADKDFVRINDNIPFFTNEDLTQTEPYAHYGALDHQGRVTTADALLDESLMPPAERGSMDGSIKPTGWQQKRYDNVPGGWLYNRSHLIGYQLAGSENDQKNLMTGTRWFNVEGMLPFENFVAHYIESTGHHVRYRITPVFQGNDQLAAGIFMEGFSIEDNGEGLCFNIFVPNRQPGITIDYATGKSQNAD